MALILLEENTFSDEAALSGGAGGGLDAGGWTARKFELVGLKLQLQLEQQQ